MNLCLNKYMEFKIKNNKIIKYTRWNQKYVVIPEGIKEIGYEAFREHNEIEYVKIPNSIENISFKAFYKFKGIVSKEAIFNLDLNFKDKHIQDIIQFGKYPYTKNGDCLPIEWKIIDETKDSLLIISKECIDCQQYYDDWQVISWKNSSIRNWLNTLFYNYAFTEIEKSKIMQTDRNVLKTLPIQDNQNTKDYIFLLNENEVKSYFPNPLQRISKASPHTIIKGMDNYESGCWWWIQNPGKKGEYCAVGIDGNIYNFGIYMTYYHGIRPCLWIQK